MAELNWPRRAPFPTTSAEFEAILDLNVPFVFTGMSGAWPAMTKWTPEYLAKTTGDNLGTVFVSKRNPEVRGAYTEEKMTISALLEKLKDPDYKKSELQYYLAGDNLEKNFAALYSDVLPLPFGTDDNSVLRRADLASLGLWVGSTGQVSNAHFDCAHNMMTVIRGEKVFTVCSPENFLAMAAHTWKSCGGNDQNGEIYRFSQIDVINPDLKQFPGFAKVQSKLKAIHLQRGETLLLPCGWWHHVMTTGDPSDDINIALNTFWNASDAFWARKELRFLTQFRTKYERKA